jgi:hypothetical protein
MFLKFTSFKVFSTRRTSAIFLDRGPADCKLQSRCVRSEKSFEGPESMPVRSYDRDVDARGLPFPNANALHERTQSECDVKSRTDLANSDSSVKGLFAKGTDHYLRAVEAFFSRTNIIRRTRAETTNMHRLYTAARSPGKSILQMRVRGCSRSRAAASCSSFKK